MPSPTTWTREGGSGEGYDYSEDTGDSEDIFILLRLFLPQVTIKYSKLGLEDFDFKHYNNTLFAGLEPHIPNAYCNCMIQVRVGTPAT